MDVGGGAPASVGAFREIYQEGVIIPPVKMVRTGTIVDDIFRLVLAQIRSKRETAGDFRAQFAANNTGVRRLTALFERYGPETVNFYTDELIAYTDRRTQAELAKLPKGEYLAEGYVDNDGFTDQPVRLVVRVAVDAEGVLFDFTGSDAQRRAPVNSTYAQTYPAAAYALKCVADPDLPVNEGFYRHVRPVAPEGTVVNCVHPFPVVAGWKTQVRLNDTIFKALAQAIPEQMIAGTKAMQCHAGWGGGYGPPEERDPALVLRDVREGKVSVERAREVYKVAVDTATWTVDESETANCRRRRDPETGQRPRVEGVSAR